MTSLYWMLISKGIRTYRFLPAFFREFYPSHRAETPVLFQWLLHSLGQRRFQHQYDPRSGVIRAGCQSYYLNSDLATVTENRMLNPDVRFFLKRNPGFIHGDELLCLAEFKPENIKRFMLREVLKRTSREEYAVRVNER